MEENNQNRGGFEPSDINVFAVGKFGVALLLATIAAMALVFGLFTYFRSMEGGQAKTVDPTKVFPQPQLEKTPIPNLAAYHASQDAILNSYGWVDQSKGVVRIPVARAMDLVVQKGLPARTAPPASSDAGASVPTESGLGPKMLPPGGPLGVSK